ncbi:MAG: helix-turn-helix domain-containing protein [Acutalibacteraceae bacterium]
MSDSIREILRDNLEYYINGSDFTQKNLAEQIGVSKGAITNWLNGSNSPNIEVLARLCQVLNVKMSDMLTKKDNVIANINDAFHLNDHEKKVITAYRQQPSMQEAVDRLLCLEQEYIKEKHA